MQNETIAEIARIAAVEALKRHNELIIEEFDARYHDVKLLMRNYRKLKAHFANISPEILEVNSICSMQRKTKLMMSHVDKMLLVYKTLCQESAKTDEMRRWDALYLRYIAEEKKKIEDIAFELKIDKRTFHRDINKAIEDMAVLLFGIEAIGTWRHNTRPVQNVDTDNEKSDLS